jgi:SAM-dependent methyltransferase
MTTFFIKQIKTLGSAYNKATIWGKVLIFIVLLMLLVLVFKGFDSTVKEGFEQADKLLIKTDNDIYDDFYVGIYDYLVFNNLKDEYEIGEIINKTSPTSKSKILDVGSGTGHHVSSMGAKGLDVLGIDISPSMIEQSKKSYPDYKFQVGDALNAGQFEPDSFTHIMCMYFTLYYFKDKQQFFNNCMKWLMPGGFIIVHLVDREIFDPILPPGNPLLLVSPQRYAKERITSTKVKFTDFAYSADFKLDKANNTATFIEKFKNDKDGKVRKNEHTMYMPDTQEIVDEALGAGFILQGQVDLLNCQYEYQYLYIFVKPN